MNEVIFLKTSAFGGYNKEDVDNLLQMLYSQISELESQLREIKSAVEQYKTGTEQEKIYESILSEERAKIAGLQTENQTLSQNLESLKAENIQKENEISVLKENVSGLEQNIAEANMKIASLQTEDEATAFSMIFVEAKKSADIIISQAQKKASEFEENSKKLAENIINDANNKASEITAEANNNLKQMEVSSGNMKALMLDDVNKINQVFSRLKDTFEEFTKSGNDIIGKSENILSETKNTLENNGIPVFKITEEYKPEFPDAPANEYDDADFISDINSVNIVSDNFMDEFQDSLERDIMDFEAGKITTSSNDNISLEELARQAEAINDKKSETPSLEEIAKQAETINDKKSETPSLEEIAKQAEAINDKKSETLSLEEIAKQAEAISQ